MSRIAMIAAALCAIGAIQLLAHTVLEGHRMLTVLFNGSEVVRVERVSPDAASHTEAARMQRASAEASSIVVRRLVGGSSVRAVR